MEANCKVGYNMKADIQQMEFIDPKLRHIAAWLEDITGLEFTLTSMVRISDDGVHGQLPLRGIDLRVRHELIGINLETIVNNAWTYDPKRPELECALLHGEGSNLHLHLQVHFNTV